MSNLLSNLLTPWNRQNIYRFLMISVRIKIIRFNSLKVEAKVGDDPLPLLETPLFIYFHFNEGIFLLENEFFSHSPEIYYWSFILVCNIYVWVYVIVLHISKSPYIPSPFFNRIPLLISPKDIKIRIETIKFYIWKQEITNGKALIYSLQAKKIKMTSNKEKILFKKRYLLYILQSKYKIFSPLSNKT